MSLYVPTRTDLAWQRCVTPCTLWMPPGDYVFEVDATDDGLAGRRKVSIDGVQTLYFEPRASSTRTLGLTLAVSGTIVSVVGLVAGFVSFDDALNHDSDSGPDYQSERAAANARAERWLLFGFVGGAAISAIGWVLFAPTRPSVTRESATASPSRPLDTTPAIAIVPTPHGAAILGGFTF